MIKTEELENIFSIAQNLYQRKYPVYGVINEENKFIGIINAKSLIKYIETDSLSEKISFVEDEAVRNLFHDSQNPIQTMAVIHEQLYQSDDHGTCFFLQFEPFN